MSEIMFATRNSRRATPQWIEFYNTSDKNVDLRGWQLNLEVQTETNTPINKTLTLTFEGVHSRTETDAVDRNAQRLQLRIFP